MSPVLEVRHLEKAFGGLRATRGVSLSIPNNELHAVIGPNGAGKTTLIAQLFGEVRPDSGSIQLDGTDITRLPTYSRARMGMARSFQITTLARELTVLENMLVAVLAHQGHAYRFWRSVRRDPALVEQALIALSKGGLQERATDAVASLSHGEQRQLELAMALTGKPKLVLLDEPMAGLGPEESRTMTRFLKDLKGHTAIVLVEHDMDAVFGLADRITVLVRGQVVAVGRPDEIRRDPAVREAYLGEDEEC